MNINDILIQPVMTEKATQLTKRKTYTFIVHNDAQKNQISYALQTLYKVKVGAIRIICRKGKIRRVGKKMTPKKEAARKIAYVTLKEGKIDIFPEV